MQRKTQEQQKIDTANYVINRLRDRIKPMLLKAFDGEVEAVSIKRYAIDYTEDQIIMSIMYRQRIYNWTLGNVMLSTHLTDSYYLYSLLRQNGLAVEVPL